MRLDKFLWCVRLYKTRTLATEACKEEKVLLQNNSAKASSEVKIGTLFTIKTGSIRYQYKVVGIPTNRVAAKLVEQYILDETPQEIRDKNQLILTQKRENQLEGIIGRPTKQHRRKLDQWKDQHYGFNE